MIPFKPKDKKSISDMYIRIGIFTSLIFVLLFTFVPEFTVYGGMPFISYSEAIKYFADKIWFNLTDGNLMMLPIKILLLPFLASLDCNRPGCEWMGVLFLVVYYTFWFYGISVIKKNFFPKNINYKILNS